MKNGPGGQGDVQPQIGRAFSIVSCFFFCTERRHIAGIGHPGHPTLTLLKVVPSQSQRTEQPRIPDAGTIATCPADAGRPGPCQNDGPG